MNNDLIITVIDGKETMEFLNLSALDLDDLIYICRKANKELKISFDFEEEEENC